MLPTPSRKAIRQAALALGLTALAGLALALGSYHLLAAGLSTAVAAACFASAMQRPWTAFLAFATGGTVVVWLAFGTTRGYFWLNQHRFEAVLAELAATPGLTSLSLGTDDRVQGADGNWRTFDSYRFVNETLVTHYREQVAPHAGQPILHVEDVLRSAGIPEAAYWRLRHALQRLSLQGVSRGPEGQVNLSEPRQGGTPWMTGFVFSPSSRTPTPTGIESNWRLAPHWFYFWAAL